MFCHEWELCGESDTNLDPPPPALLLLPGLVLLSGAVGIPVPAYPEAVGAEWEWAEQLGWAPPL